MPPPQGGLLDRGRGCQFLQDARRHPPRWGSTRRNQRGAPLEMSIFTACRQVSWKERKNTPEMGACIGPDPAETFCRQCRYCTHRTRHVPSPRWLRRSPGETETSSTRHRLHLSDCHWTAAAAWESRGPRRYRGLVFPYQRRSQPPHHAAPLPSTASVSTLQKLHGPGSALGNRPRGTDSRGTVRQALLLSVRS
jgi:hypothetical protein